MNHNLALIDHFQLRFLGSNLGSNQLLEQMEQTKGKITKDEIMSILEPIIKTHFRPEFINRLDEILPFLPLKKEDMKQIVTIQLGHLVNRLKDREVTLNWTDTVVSHLAEAGYDPIYRARPLKRLIQQVVINMLSKAILEGKIPSKSTIELDYRNGQFTYKVEVN